MMLQKLTLSLEEPRFKLTPVAEQLSALQYWHSSVSTEAKSLILKKIPSNITSSSISSLCGMKHNALLIVN